MEYKYDAWGASTYIYSASTTIDTLAFDNPFRYRGYVWDEESELYYLSSRYYNLEMGRFINADAYVMSDEDSLLSSNMFTYCLNNPTNRIDYSGDFSRKIHSEDTQKDGNPFNDIGGGGEPTGKVQVRTGTTIKAVNYRGMSHNVKNGQTAGSKNYKGTYRVDYEYNGNGSGNVHIHPVQGGKIHVWDLSNGWEIWYNTLSLISKLMNNGNLVRAVQCSVDTVLGLAGYGRDE